MFVRNYFGQKKNGVRVAVSNILLLCSLALLLLFALPATAQGSGVNVSFYGPESAHVTCDYTWSGNNGQLRFVVDEPGDVLRVLAESVEGTNPSLNVRHHDTGLNTGTYNYRLQRRAISGEWQFYDDGYNNYTAAVNITGDSASGTLLYDETVVDATIFGSVTVPEERELTLGGSIEGLLSIGNDIVVNGSLSISGSNLELSKINIILNANDHNLSGITGGSFVVHGDDNIFSNCSGNSFDLRTSAVLESIEGSSVDIVSLSDQAQVRIKDSGGYPNFEDRARDIFITEVPTWNFSLQVENSTIRSHNQTFSKGTFTLDQVVWREKANFGAECVVDAVDVNFLGAVTIGDNDINKPLPDTKFQSRGSNSLFTSLTVSRVKPGNVIITDGLFSGLVYINGGYPEFNSCEFDRRVILNTRTGAIIEQSLFRGVSGGIDIGQHPTWTNASSPNPTIQNNAFMDRIAINNGNVSDQAITSIGSNYYGDRKGWLPLHLEHGFLGYNSGHAGARIMNNLMQTINIAPHLETSPVQGPPRDKRVIPNFWVNGHIYGQNTISHDMRRGYMKRGPILKGRDTLLSVHLLCSDNNVGGVRLYAEWDGKIVEAESRGNIPVHRDQSLYSEPQVRGGGATFNFILPAAQESMPVKVYLDLSNISGYDNPPTEPRLLINQNISFTDPPHYPLRIHVVPIEIRGTLWGTYGRGNPDEVLRVLREELPDMLPLPADKLIVSQLGAHVHRPHRLEMAYLTSYILMNRIAAELATGRWLREQQILLERAPHIIVAVMPKGMMAGGAEGAVFTSLGRSRVAFVAEDYPVAVLHELGHVVGLYTGGGNEQYDLSPPDGIKVERVTKFLTESEGSSARVGAGRIEHRAGEEDFWYPPPTLSIYHDIMGNADPVWTIISTINGFHNWFNSTLTASAYSANISGAKNTVAVGSRRIFVCGAAVGKWFNASSSYIMPDSLVFLDLTDQEIEVIPPLPLGPVSASFYFKAYNADGEEIYEERFALPHDNRDPLWMATFDVPVEAVSYSIEKYDTGHLIAHLSSAGLQSVKLLKPLTGTAIGGMFEAEWEVQASGDTDSARILHTLFYKTAPGDSWILALGPTEATEITAPSSFLPDSEYLALKLVSTDGFNSVEDIVEGLSVSERAPLVSVLSPYQGDRSREGVLWYLAAQVIDSGDGEPEDPGQWSSSLDGDLGEGRSLWLELSAGTHLLRYEVQGKDGLTGSAEVTVSVHETLDSIDLNLEESELFLNNSLHSFTPKIMPGEQNKLKLRLRNQGVEAFARVRLYVTSPANVETLLGETGLNMEPFEEAIAEFSFTPEAEGTYKIRAEIDDVTPEDPDSSNNTREWLYSTPGAIINVRANPGGTATGSGEYSHDEAVTVRAIPKAGTNWIFDRWTEDEMYVSNQAVYTFTAKRNVNRIFTAHFTKDPGTSPVPGIDGRLSGDNRFQTAIAISKDSYPDAKSANAVVIARSHDFADALPGGVLAFKENGPLLLTRTDELIAEVETEIDRVLKDDGTIYILGGTAAISSATESQLRNMGSYNVKRVAGSNRTETAYKIAQEVGDASGKTIIANSHNFPDALAISSYAAREGIPILTSGSAALSEDARNYLRNYNVNQVYVVGGPAVISSTAFSQAEELVGTGNVERLGGSNRFDTARAIADRFFPAPGTAALVYGRNFPDALAGGVNAARYNAPVLLVEEDSIPVEIRPYLTEKRSSLNEIIVYGGTSVISDMVKEEARSLIE